MSHLRENGRIVVMLCAFSGPPEAVRSVVRIELERIAESCGYGVPLMEHVGEREHYRLSAEKRLRVGGPGALARRRAESNARSIDGLPALDRQ